MFVFPETRRALLLAYRWTIHLRTMSNGEPHPTARAHILSYNFAPEINGGIPWILEPSVKGSRLVLLREMSSEPKTQIVVWNWITGEMLLVRQPLLRDHTLTRTVHLGTRCRVLPICTVC